MQGGAGREGGQLVLENSLQRASIRFCYLFLRSIDSFELVAVESVMVIQILSRLSRNPAWGA